MTSPGFSVDTDAVSTHAGVLDDAGSAVTGMRPSLAELDSDAYGVIGDFFSANATSAMRAGVEAVDRLASELHELATAARESVAAYLEVESRVVDGLLGVDVPTAPSPVGADR